MTPSKTAPRPSIRHFFGFVGLAVVMATFHFVPGIVDFTEVNELYWLGLFQLFALFIASVLATVAAARGPRNIRNSWKFFAIAHWVYLAGNLCYGYWTIIGYAPSFPNLPEAAFFVMAIFTAIGMADYGDVQRDRRKTNVYNFVMVYCAISVACLLLLNNGFMKTSLGDLGTVMAFLYPALWLSVTAFGIIALGVYKHGRRTAAFRLLVGAAAAEAIADIFYARDLLDGTYIQGGLTQFLWVASIALSIWAAVEHLMINDELATEREEASHRVRSTTALASLPSVAIAIFAVAAVVSGTFGYDSNYVVATLLMSAAFAAAAGLREHATIKKLEGLRDEATEGRRQLNKVLETTSDSVIVMDRHWKLTYFNRSASRILAGDGGLTVGRSLWDIMQAGSRFPSRVMLETAMLDQVNVEYEAPFASDDVYLNIRAFPTEEGMSIFFSDISEQRRARIKIHDLAMRDTLTGLANRTSFHLAIDAAMKQNTEVGILLLDLDRFKEINDLKGHQVGDEVLRVVASRLTACAKGALVARLGGDEFAIILGAMPECDAAALAENIGTSLRKPVRVDDDLMYIGASIGIAIGDPAKVNAEILFRNADIALYEVKNSGRDGVAFFRKAMETLLLERNSIKQDLATALANDEFELYFQPLVDLGTGKVASCEALLRWNHPKRGLISPDTFIPLIEENGLIVPIGAWVMRTACREAMTWPDEIAVAVNISTKQFFDPALIDTIKNALDDSKLPPHRLELEITESALLTDTGDNLDTLNAFRGLGLRIALDDFGTGYSSLGYLHKFRFDKLKIDKSFVQGLNDKDESEAIVRTVISLGKTLGMAITAEGVETQEQYDWLEESCQYAQGHFISRPINTADIDRFLRERHQFSKAPIALQQLQDSAFPAAIPALA